MAKFSLLGWGLNTVAQPGLNGRAGYQPREALAFWKRFAEYKNKNGGGKQVGFLSTHPLDDQRIRQIEGLIPQAEMEYRKP